jgi:hypothetical protein
MGQISASSTVLIDVEPGTVLAAVADFLAVRPKKIPRFSDYRVLEAGRVHAPWRRGSRRATKSRTRDVKANVDVAEHTVIEKDANSTMVTNWTVAPAGPGLSLTVKTSWQGAGGIGGLFEKTFAPLGLRKMRGLRGSRDTATSASGVLLRILRRHISAEPAGFFMLPSSQD